MASSNSAVDNVLCKITRDGIPDSAGGAIHSQLFLIARQGYDIPAHLRRCTLHSQAFPYNENAERRRYPSMHVRRTFAESVIIFLDTASICGSSKFLELPQSCDIILHDEADAFLETETLVALANTRVNIGSNRLYYIGGSDHNQLSALTFVPHVMASTKVSCIYR